MLADWRESPPDRYPFLLQADDGQARWWRVLQVLALGGLAGLLAASLVMLLVLVIAAGLMAAGASVGVTEAIGVLTDFARTGRTLQSYIFELALAGLSSFTAAWTFIAVAARIERRPQLSFLTVAPRFRWRLVSLGLVVATPVLGVSVIIAYLTGDASQAPVLTPGVPIWARLAYVAASAIFLCLAALAEEMLFRGWLLQQTSVYVGKVALLLAVNGLLFSLAHADPNLGSFLIRAAMGAAWAWVVLRTGGLEFALGAHLANNLMISLFIKPVSLAPIAARPFDYLELAIEVIGLALMVGVVEWLVRTRAMGRAPSNA